MPDIDELKDKADALKGKAGDLKNMTGDVTDSMDWPGLWAQKPVRYLVYVVAVLTGFNILFGGQEESVAEKSRGPNVTANSDPEASMDGSVVTSENLELFCSIRAANSQILDQVARDLGYSVHDSFAAGDEVSVPADKILVYFTDHPASSNKSLDRIFRKNGPVTFVVTERVYHEDRVNYAVDIRLPEGEISAFVNPTSLMGNFDLEAERQHIDRTAAERKRRFAPYRAKWEDKYGEGSWFSAELKSVQSGIWKKC